MSLNDYEPVASRFARFITWLEPQEFSARVLSEMVSTPGADVCVFKTTIYIDGVPVATGWAEEIRDTSGKRSVNSTSHVENCETSSLGRALANFPLHNFAGSDFSKRPSREEMSKVERQSTWTMPEEAQRQAEGGVTVKGPQHGPLPEWFINEAANFGVTSVWDNRDKVAGTKRPWFKDVNGDKAFWPPKGTTEPAPKYDTEEEPF